MKFRAWRTKKKQQMAFVYGLFFNKDGELYKVRVEPQRSIGVCFWRCDRKKDSFELMQYTGLKDKNGVEIYEGDIVKLRHNETHPFEVYWEDRDISFRMRFNGEMQFDKTSPLMFAKFGEVIGNIYENKDLLEGK